MKSLLNIIAKLWKLDIRGLDRLNEYREAYKVWVYAAGEGCYGDAYARYFNNCCEAYWYHLNFKDRVSPPEIVLVKGVN